MVLISGSPGLAERPRNPLLHHMVRNFTTQQEVYEKITVAAFRALPKEWLGRAGGHVLTRIVARVAGSRALSTIGRVAPLAIGMAVGAGFDWITVSALGKAAVIHAAWPEVPLVLLTTEAPGRGSAGEGSSPRSPSSTRNP